MDALDHPLVAPLLAGLRADPAVGAVWVTGFLAQNQGDALSSPHLHVLWLSPTRPPAPTLAAILDATFPAGRTDLPTVGPHLETLLHPDPDHPERSGGLLTLSWTDPAGLPRHVRAHGPHRELLRMPHRMSPALSRVLDGLRPPPYPPPDGSTVHRAMLDFWVALSHLAGALVRADHLAAAALLARARRCVLEMMSALNGSGPPPTPARVRPFLGPDQAHALTRSLDLPHGIARASWIGQAVALVVIYRWYAPQLVERFGLPPVDPVAEGVLARLARSVPDWPAHIETT